MLDKHDILISAKWHRICITPALILQKKEADSVMEKLVKEFKNKLTMKKVNGPNSPKLLEKFEINNFPSIVLVNGSPKIYTGDRSMKDLKKFLK